jgi:putative two-component system response regulator
MDGRPQAGAYLSAGSPDDPLAMTDRRISQPSRLSRAIRAVTEPQVRRILVVDDEELIRTAVAKFLRSKGYEVTTCDSGQAALAALEREKHVLMLADVRMPGMTGLALLPASLAIDPDLAVMMLTAVNDAPTATEALAHGAWDYLMKPIELNDLAAAVERVLHKRDLQIEQRKVERLIREEVAAQTEELRRDRELLGSVVVDVVRALVNAQEAKDPYLRGHSDRVADLAASMAAFLKLSDDEVESMRLAGRLMDVGKIGIRESVLNKPGALTPEEFEHVKTHVQIGIEILSSLKTISHVIPYIGDHHEHWDGGGYPRGLKGDAISLGGRILAAADAFDALTSQRAWREPLSPADAVRFLSERTGTLLDPKVFEALRSIVTRRKTLQFLDANAE